MRRAIGGLLTSATFFGCAAYHVSDYATPPARRWDRPALEAQVVIPVWEVPTQAGPNRIKLENEASELARALKSSGLFSAANIVEEAEPSAVSVLPQPEPGRCFTEPMLTVLTVGVIPHVGCVPLGFRFVVSGPSLPRPTTIDTLDEVTVVWGWLAPLFYPFPGWTYRYPKEQEAAQLRSALAGELESVLSQ